jgi:hypothetical protein
MHMRSSAHPRSPVIGALAPGDAYRRHSVSPNVGTHAHAHGPVSSASTTNREGSIGSSSPALDANGNGTGQNLTLVTKRKKKKPGWKGYAMQYLDDDGEVLEERLRDETPPKEGEVPVQLASASTAAPVSANPIATASTNAGATTTTTALTPSTAPAATHVKSRSPGKRCFPIRVWFCRVVALAARLT